MNRIDKVQAYVDGALRDMADVDWRRWGYTHLFGVAQGCSMIAMKRGVNVELATVAGLLHDIATYTTMDGTRHAHRGAVMAREILGEMAMFSPEEVDMVCSAIHNHSDKSNVHAPMDEVLKDADVLQHALYNPLEPVAEKERVRFAALKQEFGMA